MKSAKIELWEKQAIMLEIKNGRDDVFVERYSKQLGIQTLTHDVVAEFVKAIRVFAPDRVDVILNFADEYAKIANITGQ